MTDGRFPIGEGRRAFLARHYPDVPLTLWNDWRWQLRARIRTGAALAGLFSLTPAERQAVEGGYGQLPLGITPYFASLLGEYPASPLRRTCIPVEDEFRVGPGEAADPLGEDRHTPVPGLVHRYPDRVLFLVTPFCSTYCRYCTRSRIVGHTDEGATENEMGGEHTGAGYQSEQWQRALTYITAHPEIRDVLLSGGDPLTLGDHKLDWLLGRLRAIPHVEFIRIGTKVPAVLPMRITPGLIRVLRRHKPWLSLHFTHPDELTPEAATACARLADAGLPLGSQTVLLAGINDQVPTLKALFQGLLRIRVRPYYLYQCDPILGSAHFRTPVERGLEMIRGLRGYTTGYAVPSYVIDAPGGGGKIPLLPDYRVGREGNALLLSNYEGAVFRYPDETGESRT